MSLIHSKPLALTLMLTLGSLAQADPAPARGTSLPLYQQECSACHLAYPAGLLPASSWQRLMGSLNKHFGTDASLDATGTRAIRAWLTANAGSYRRVSEAPPQDRITQSAWFMREHRAGEVPPEVWKRPAVGSPSNCAACHRSAAQGSFNERDITIPG